MIRQLEVGYRLSILSLCVRLGICYDDTMTDDDPTPRARHLSVLQEIVTLFDSLPPKAQKEVLAFLAASQGVVIKEPTAPRSSYGYRYGAKRGK